MDYLWLARGILLFCVGGIALYTDYKKGKIPNALTFPAIGLGIIITLISSPVELPLILAVSFLVAFFLFYIRVWAPGDAKLFLAFALLLPPFTSQNQLINVFPASLIIIYGAFPVILIHSIFHFKKVKLSWPKLSKESFKEICEHILLAISFSWPFKLFFMKFFSKATILAIIITFIIYRPLKRIIRKSSYFYYIILAGFVLQLIILKKIFVSVRELIFIFLFASALYLTFEMLSQTFLNLLNEEIPLKDIAPYMILNQNLYLDKKKTKMRFKSKSHIKPQDIEEMKRCYPKKILIQTNLKGALPLVLGMILVFFFKDIILSIF